MQCKSHVAPATELALFGYYLNFFNFLLTRLENGHVTQNLQQRTDPLLTIEIKGL